MKRNSRGFTLVEILIVVIILGILAAIVIPQFTNASTQAKTNSVSSTLQTIRSQIELFKIQHSDNPPQLTAMALPAGTTGSWVILTTKSDTLETGTAAPAGTGAFGPYLQQPPVNPLNGRSAVTTGTAADLTAGWYYSQSGGSYTVYARDAVGATITTQ